MISELKIQTFRGFEYIALHQLRRVNLLVGGNNTGKTSVLEALLLLLGDGGSVSQLPVAFRNNQADARAVGSPDDRENFWNWLFLDRDTAKEIAISAETDNEKILNIQTYLSPEGDREEARDVPALYRDIVPLRKTEHVEGQGPRKNTVPQGIVQLVRMDGGGPQVSDLSSPLGFAVARLSVRPSNPVQDAEKYNQIALEADGEERFERIMREVEPRLRRLRYAKLPGTSSPLVFADIGLSRFVPTTQMGQAFNRILHIYTEILTSKTNVLLIDEIENGIFSESLPVIWKGLFAVCEEQKVQIFATTHSRECVMAANAAAHDRGKDELSVQRLQIVNSKIEAVRLGAKHLEGASEMGLEVPS